MVATHLLAILCFLTFLAGFIDSIAGGGGLISLPAYLFIGLPIHNAMACNKFSAGIGTTFSTFRFFKNKVLDWKVALVSAISSFTGSSMGTNLALLIDEKLLNKIFVCVLPVVAVFILLKRDFGDENKSDSIPKVKAYILAFVIGIIIGFYDGLIGPGTGTFAIIAYCLIMKYDLRTASGNAKMLNFASNCASLIAFIYSGKILYSIAIPAAISGIVGNYMGAGFAIKKGAKFIRPMMIVVIVLLFAKMFLDVFGKMF